MLGTGPMPKHLERSDFHYPETEAYLTAAVQARIFENC
jgi:hypothetical protein